MADVQIFIDWKYEWHANEKGQKVYEKYLDGFFKDLEAWYIYNGQGQLEKVYGSDGSKASYNYNAQGQCISAYITDQNGNSWANFYNPNTETVIRAGVSVSSGSCVTE